jgi:hypothetical protein
MLTGALFPDSAAHNAAAVEAPAAEAADTAVVGAPVLGAAAPDAATAEASVLGAAVPDAAMAEA